MEELILEVESRWQTERQKKRKPNHKKYKMRKRKKKVGRKVGSRRKPAGTMTTRLMRTPHVPSKTRRQNDHRFLYTQKPGRESVQPEQQHKEQKNNGIVMKQGKMTRRTNKLKDKMQLGNSTSRQSQERTLTVSRCTAFRCDCDRFSVQVTSVCIER